MIGGQSYGAFITIELLLAHPERASAALLVAGTPDGLQSDRPDAVPFPSRRKELGGVAVPTLVVHGSEDQAFPVEKAEALRDAIPGAELVVIPGAGHTPNSEAPELFAGTIAPFLRRVTGAGA